ncbi:MAG: hypothetical protein EXQ86_04110 [Rhodospirillales bacterium]|nr:hypothetical protein [Rhodospirillales bacterium]
MNDSSSSPARPKSGKRLGLLYPADGTDTEILHLDRWLPAHGINGVSFRFKRPYSAAGHAPESLRRMGGKDSLGPLAKELVADGCDAIVWACTSASFIGGPEWARDQARQIEDLTGRPFTSATLSMLAAARALNAKTVDVLGAYPEPVTAMFLACVRDAGMTISGTDSLGAADGAASFRIDIRAALARFAARHPDKGNLLLLPDTAIDSLNCLDELEAIVGRPMVTATQACVWHSLQLLGVNPIAPDAGTLFRRRPVAAREGAAALA